MALDEVVYECVASTSARCNQAGWEPDTGEFWEEAWMVLGSCTGTSEQSVVFDISNIVFLVVFYHFLNTLHH